MHIVLVQLLSFCDGCTTLHKAQLLLDFLYEANGRDKDNEKQVFYNFSSICS